MRYALDRIWKRELGDPAKRAVIYLRLVKLRNRIRLDCYPPADRADKGEKTEPPPKKKPSKPTKSAAGEHKPSKPEKPKVTRVYPPKEAGGTEPGRGGDLVTRKTDKPTDTSETAKAEPRDPTVNVPRDRTKTEPADRTETKPADQTESKPDPFLQDADLSIEKKLKGPCYRGGTCRYDIVITNNGPGNYSGVLGFTDTPTLRPGWITIPSGNGACARDRGGASFTCTSNPVTLLPGHHWTTRLAIKFPRTNKRGVKNCAEVRDLDTSSPLDSNSGLVAAVQTALKRAGFNPGPADGQLGRKTRDALRQFQTSNGLGSDSPTSKKVLDALLRIETRQPDPNPQNNVSCVRTDFAQPVYDTSAPRKRPRRRKAEKGIDLSPALEIGIGIGMQMLRGRRHDSEGPPKD